MEISKESENYYLLTKKEKKYLAEAIFTSKKPRSRVMLERVKQIRQQIDRGRINHPDYINYRAVEQVNDEYCLISENESFLIPLSVYLKDKQSLSLKTIINWMLSMAEIAGQAEERGLNWPGFNLADIRIDQKGELKLADPGIIDLIKQYREQAIKLPDELFQPPELFQGETWDETGRIYSYGILFYYLLTGHPPFLNTEKADLLDEIIHTKPVAPAYYNPGISPQLNDFIMELIANEKNERPQTWSSVLKTIQSLLRGDSYQSTQTEREQFKNQASKMIKASKRSKGVKTFFRRRWKSLAVAVTLIGLIGFVFLTSGTPSEVTENTTPEQVVEMFYQAINQKSVTLLEDTTIVDLKQLDRMVSETYVIEKMQTAYNIDQQETKSLFGLKDLSLTKISDKPQPTFTASYTFYLNDSEETREFPMKDRIELGNVEGCWQIVLIKGSLEKIIEGRFEETTIPAE